MSKAHNSDVAIRTFNIGTNTHFTTSTARTETSTCNKAAGVI